MGKWYKQGFQDALDGINDPPMHPGHRSYRDYAEGHVDGDRQLDVDAEAECSVGIAMSPRLVAAINQNARRYR